MVGVHGFPLVRGAYYKFIVFIKIPDVLVGSLFVSPPPYIYYTEMHINKVTRSYLFIQKQKARFKCLLLFVSKSFRGKL